LICLGIESTAHTFGAGIVEESIGKSSNERSLRILSDVKDVYKAPLGSGIHPREASRHHSETSSQVVEKAFKQASLTPEDLDFIAYSAGPGLGPCLRTGAVVARTLASYYNKPLVPTNHAIGHIELGKMLCGLNEPMVLVISGGHTAIASNQNTGWRMLGETLDLTLGQLLDQLGRHLGLSSPAGPEIERIAQNEGGTRLIPLPYTVKGNDVSYSGLLSAAKDAFASGVSKEELCFSAQEVAFSMLTEATERALAFTGQQELLVTGGVAANRRLGSMLEVMCKERGAKIGVIPREFAGDCGSQIAAAGFLFYRHGFAKVPSDSYVKQSWRLDHVSFKRKS
jgi:N6-L-threonylcarbamoyladenine synthase